MPHNGKKPKGIGKFIGGLFVGVVLTGGSIYAYKCMKPDYLKDYEEVDDLDDYDDKPTESEKTE